jgi:shikimate dehydrogenase
MHVHYQPIDLDQWGAGGGCPELMRRCADMGFRRRQHHLPCKQSVIALLDSLSAGGAAIGAVNTVVRAGDSLVGYNTDGPGWSWGSSAPSRRRPHAGAPRRGGGAGSACADAVLRLGAKQVVIFDRIPRRFHASPRG